MIDFNGRLTTSFGVSLGTGFMLESIFQPIEDRYDPERPIPNKVKVDKYKYHFYNLITLVRNFTTSFNTVIPIDLVMKDNKFFNVFTEELLTINSLYLQTGCRPVFYLPTHDKLVGIFNNGKSDNYTTPIKRGLEIYSYLKKMKFKDIKDLNFLIDFIKFPKVEGESLVTTSYSIDLLNRNNFSLLNSHTGELILPKDFYRLYNKIGSKDMSVFPFREILVYLIGDTNTSSIINTKTRLLLHELAVKDKWNNRTTEDHIKDLIRKDDLLSPYLKSYKKTLTT